MVGHQDGFLVPQTLGNDPALFVADRHARPFRQVGAVLVEHAGIHVRNDQRLRDHRQRRSMRRMCMDNGIHARPLVIDPKVEAVGGIGHAVAFKHVEFVVEQQDVARPGFVEPEAERKTPVSTRLLATQRDLAGERRFMPVGIENAA